MTTVSRFVFVCEESEECEGKLAAHKAIVCYVVLCCVVLFVNIVLHFQAKFAKCQFQFAPLWNR